MTAQCFFHKFFARESFKRHDRFVVAQACLFLAAKVEESAVSLKHLAPTCHRVRYGGRANAEPPDDASEAGRDLKRRVLAAERAVLYVRLGRVRSFLCVCGDLRRGGVVAAASRRPRDHPAAPTPPQLRPSASTSSSRTRWSSSSTSSDGSTRAAS